MITSAPQKIIAQGTDWRFLNELKKELKGACCSGRIRSSSEAALVSPPVGPPLLLIRPITSTDWDDTTRRLVQPLLRRAVECLRYDSPVQFQGRVATEDVECASTAIRRGQLVLAVLGAANRDPDHFQHPNFHLAFGHGRHHCVGAELARLEARIAFTILFTELKTLELLPAELRHRENFNMRCYQSLPIRLLA